MNIKSLNASQPYVSRFFDEYTTLLQKILYRSLRFTKKPVENTYKFQLQERKGDANDERVEQVNRLRFWLRRGKIFWKMTPVVVFLLVEIVGQKINQKIEPLIFDMAKRTEYILVLTIYDFVSLGGIIFILLSKFFDVNKPSLLDLEERPFHYFLKLTGY